MYRLGVDILEVSRIDKALNRSKRFREKIFTEYENHYIGEKSGARTAGGIFCSKEAVSKLLGTGISGFGWKDIEVIHDDCGKPRINLYGEARKKADEINLHNIELSISHSDESIIAVAIGEIVEVKSRIVSPKFRIPKRKKDSHKGDYGKIAVIGGSVGMTGAPLMSSKAALRTGSGLVYSFVPESIAEIMQIKSLENIVMPIGDRGRGFFCRDSYWDIEDKIANADILAIGPGMGRMAETGEFVELLISNTDKIMIIDADGINHLKRFKKELESRKKNMIITPHMAEFANFLEVDIDSLKQEKKRYVAEVAEKYGITVVLKGSETVVSDGKEIYINDTGNPGMATAGSGDVLTGMIASFAGQGFGILEAAKIGVYVHGLAGDRAVEEKGEYGIIASDIIESIPYVLKEIVDI